MGKSPYLEVRVQRGGGWWAVWFNGREVGRAADPNPAPRELRIVAEGGPVRVDQVVLTRLRKP